MGKSLLLIACITLGSLALIAQESKPQAIAGLSVSGVYITKRFSPKEGEDPFYASTNQFNVKLSEDGRWMIEIRPISKIETIIYFSFDGKESFFVRYGGMMAKRIDGKMKEVPNSMAKDHKHAAYLGEGDFPLALEDGLARPHGLWLAFGSGGYFKTTEGNDVPLPWLAARRSVAAYGFNCENNLQESAPYLPRELKFVRSYKLDPVDMVAQMERHELMLPSNRLLFEDFRIQFDERRAVWGDGFLAGVYKAESFSEKQGIQIPERFSLTAFRPVDNTVYLEHSGVVTNIAAATLASSEFRPPILTALVVFDQRFRFRDQNKNVELIHYDLAPQDTWKSKDSAELQEIFAQKKSASTRWRPPTPMSRTNRLLVLVVFFLLSSGILAAQRFFCKSG